MQRDHIGTGHLADLNSQWATVTAKLRNAEHDLYDLFRRYTDLQKKLHSEGDDRGLRFNAPMASCFDEWVRLDGKEPTFKTDELTQLDTILGKLR